jgi:hypothetical protein
MEQRLEATYLRPGLFERAAALGIGAVAIARGSSLLPRHFLAVALHAPRNRGAYRQSKGSCTQSEPLTVTQDKPFIVAQPEPFKVELTIKVQQPFPGVAGGLAGM